MKTAQFETWRIGFLAGLMLLFVASLAQAETWKAATSRKSDGAPLEIDTDYFVEHGELVEFRARIRLEKNLFNLLLPAGEEEDRYVVNCAAKKVGLIYQKVTKGNSASVERDALPSAVAMVDIPPDTMLVPVTSSGMHRAAKKVGSTRSSKLNGGTDRSECTTDRCRFEGSNSRRCDGSL